MGVLCPVSLNPPVQHEVHRVWRWRANQRQGKPASAQLLHQPGSQISGNRLEAGVWLPTATNTHLVCAYGCLHGNWASFLLFLVYPETAGGNHKNVCHFGKKRPVYKIRKSDRWSEFTCVWRSVLKNVSLCSRNWAVSRVTWLFRWFDFSIKRKKPSMQKSSRFGF